jgi:hypothetical protein
VSADLTLKSHVFAKQAVSHNSHRRPRYRYFFLTWTGPGVPNEMPAFVTVTA